MYEKILVPIDGSEGSWKALARAKALGEKFGSELLLLNVAHPYNHVAAMAFSEQNISSEVQEHGRMILDMAQEKLAGYSHKITAELAVGNPAKQIIAAAEEAKVDAVVIGSRGLSGIEEFLMGSVSVRVAQHVPVDVIIVK